MKNIFGGGFFEGSRQMAMAMIACGVATASAVHAAPSNGIVIVPPTELPELVRQGGDALLLRETIDGRTMLYVEQDHGSRLATLDVTDPAHVKDEGSVQLATSGPFDFVSPVGTRAELIRFRQAQESAMLDFRKDKLPKLETIQDLTVTGAVTTLGSDGLMVAGQPAESGSLREYQVVGTANSQDRGHAFDVKQVHDAVTNAGTGTTFLLTQGGLYLIRRPAVEFDKRQRAQQWFEQHVGS